MKIIAATTNKGGEGKTKISTLLAEYLCEIKNKKGLAIDLDPQCNFSSRFLKMEIDPSSQDGKMPPQHPFYDPNDPNDVNWDGISSIADIFYGRPVYPYPTTVNFLEIAPAHGSKLLAAEAVTRDEVVEKIHMQLNKFFQYEDVQSLYDFAIIDTPPSKGPLTRSAFKAASHIIIPAQMEEYSIQGVYGMLQLWKQETYTRSSKNPIKLIGILPNKLRNITLHTDFLDGLRKNKGIGEFIMPFSLKERAVYAEVDVNSAMPRSIFKLPEKHPARQEAEDVCNFIYKEVFENE